MSGRAKFFLTLLVMSLLFLAFEIFLFHNRSDSQREHGLLLEQYYKLAKTDPDAAQRALLLLFEQNPHDQKILRELGFWYLHAGDTNSALKYFQLAVQNDPADFISNIELAKLYMLINLPDKAIPLLQLAVQSNDLVTQETARDLLDQLHYVPAKQVADTNHSLQPDFLKFAEITRPLSLRNLCFLQVEAIPPAMTWIASSQKTLLAMTSEQLPFAINYTPITFDNSSTSAASTIAQAQGTPAAPMTERYKLLNEFYMNKTKNPDLAWHAIQLLVAKYPNDTVALKEAGYFALSKKWNEIAFEYLDRAYKLTKDPMLAMQNGYILDGLGKSREAYNYFDLATKNPNLEERHKAEIALTNLRGMQTKFLPNPFFLDVFYNPLYYSRFDLVVHPIITRLGVLLNKTYQWQLYFSYRRTWDNRSGLAGGLPQIFQDSTSIYALGTQIQPFPKLPLVAFFEAGKARNLVPDIEPHWRGDLRGGLAFYKDWGREAEFTFHPTFPFKFEADLYGDAIYYSRYQNWIGTVRFRPGLEIFSYLASSIDLYFRGFVIEDTQRQFYNNLAEYGLGVAFIPTNRYNIAFRYEFTQGHYLPAGSPSPNPYGPNYHNNLIECDFFFRF